MELNDFLVKAKINTYASNGENREKKLEDGSKELTYENSGWKYRDRYFGFNSFVGEEIVFKNNKAEWSMNYHGKIISNEVDPQKIYQFLKKSLQLVPADYPFRGPIEFKDGDWRYKNEREGMLDNFNGNESIYFQGIKVYNLKYHGGSIIK